MRTTRSAGFTLMEIMVALTILGMLSLVVLAGLRVSTRAWEAGNREVEQQQRFRILFDRLFQEVKSSFTYRVRDENRVRLAFVGQADYFEIISAADSMTSLSLPTGLKRMAMYVAEGGVNGLQGLVIRESLLDYGEDFFSEEEEETPGVEYVVAEDVTAVSFQYFYYPKLRVYDREGDEEGKWTDTWGGLDEEIYMEGAEFDPEDEEAQEEMEFYRYSSLNLPVGMEVTITWLNEDGEPVTLPPVYIALKDSAVLGLERRL